ncbi:S8/S53 family peptidase [Salegentibacter sp. BDJ18]|uniref:S8 family peptidase n=1 Tax=Salegentibacter sp. BDJ18 TaxID=2816376 RepID=UPI001AAFA4C4|nr:S8/S53 family peptidase [Salegentibacter sp. BDJ18]MBO2546149.1 S8/S53 family peptidase [Salegentibacter sp. BDJ18]
MECFKPGEVVVQPIEGGRRFLESREFDVLYSVEDFIDYYTEKEEENVNKKFYSFPSVVKVPEGEELQFSRNYRALNNIQTAIPNYHITPLYTEPTVNIQVIEDIMKNLKCNVQSRRCGDNVKIAILDTGINPSFLPYSNQVFSKQFATDIPSLNLKPVDNNGHGSLVAYIINSIAPGAQILSFKVMDNQGTVGSLLSALYLAETKYKPEIYNLSLAFAYGLGGCANCGSDIMINSQQLETLFKVIDEQRGSSALPLIVAAAGNNTSSVKMPASFNNVLAVGSFTPGTHFNGYSRIDDSKFILAPGGLKAKDKSIAYRTFNNNNILYEGTSFAAAFVSGISARFLCSKKGGSACGNSHTNSLEGRDFVMDCLKTYADKSFSGYDKNIHGLGFVQYT